MQQDLGGCNAWEMNEQQEKLTLSVLEAARLLGVGRTTVYQAIKRNEIPHLTVGGRILIPTAALQRLIESAK